MAMAKLSAKGVAVSARIDPIIPGINDAEIEQLAAAVSRAGAGHITSSTFKARPGNMKKIISAFPQEGATLESLFARGSKVAGSCYLPEEMRRDSDGEGKRACTARRHYVLHLPGRMGKGSGDKLRWISFIVCSWQS